MKSKIKLIGIFCVLITSIGTFPEFVYPESLTNGILKGDEKILTEPHPFYDAQILLHYLQPDGKTIIKEKVLNVLNVLKRYSKSTDFQDKINLVNDQGQLSLDDIEALIGSTEDKVMGYLDEFRGQNNPFLADYIQILVDTLIDIKEDIVVPRDLKAVFEAEKATFDEAPPTAPKGILSPTILVDALGSLIAKRFKEELAIAYLTKFRTQVKENRLRFLFPSTADLLVNSDIFNFKLFIPTLKDASQNDLNNLNSNLKNFLIEHRRVLEENYKELFNENAIVELEKIQIWKITDKIKQIAGDKNKRGDLAKLKELKIIIENKDILNFAIIILELLRDIKEGEPAVEIIDNIDASEYLGKIDPRISNPIRVLALVSRNLRNKKGDGWIAAKEFKTLLQPGKKILRKLFVGLIYAREVDKFNNIIINGEKLNTIITVEKIDKMIAYMEQIIDVTKKIKNKISDIKNIEDKEGKVGYEKYHGYLTKVFELIEVGIDTSQLIGKKEVEAIITENLGYARRVLEISRNIHEKTYGIALVNVLELLRKLLPDGSVIKKGVLEYGTFMVNLVKAKDSKEIEKVLDAAVLPVGSYCIKRTSRFNISFNAYPGGFIGGEILTPGEQEIKGEPLALNLAFTAPVGLAFSWGKVGYKIVKSKETVDNPEERKRKIGTSHSVFLSAIDIGAVTSFRLSGADSGLPEFKWENILAPGLYYMYGFKNSPISIGVGIQYGPQLREIRAAEATVAGANGTNISNGGNGENGENGSQQGAEGIIKSSAFRFGLIVAVDIPIFNLHSKPKITINN